MARVRLDPAVADRASLDNEIARLRGLDVGELRARWHRVFGRRAPPHLPRHLLFRFWPIGCKSIGSAIWMPTAGVCLTGSVGVFDGISRLVADFNRPQTELGPAPY